MASLRIGRAEKFLSLTMFLLCLQIGMHRPTMTPLLVVALLLLLAESASLPQSEKEVGDIGEFTYNYYVKVFFCVWTDNFSQKYQV